MRLKRELPLAGRGRPTLLSWLNSRAMQIGASTPLIVTDIFDARDAHGLMCRFVVKGQADPITPFFAPLEDVVFDRRSTMVKDIARRLISLSRRRDDAHARDR